MHGKICKKGDIRVRVVPKEIINGKIVGVKEKRHMSAVEQKRISIQRSITKKRSGYGRTTV